MSNSSEASIELQPMTMSIVTTVLVLFSALIDNALYIGSVVSFVTGALWLVVLTSIIMALAVVGYANMYRQIPTNFKNAQMIDAYSINPQGIIQTFLTLVTMTVACVVAYINGWVLNAGLILLTGILLMLLVSGIYRYIAMLKTSTR